MNARAMPDKPTVPSHAYAATPMVNYKRLPRQVLGGLKYFALDHRLSVPTLDVTVCRATITKSTG